MPYNRLYSGRHSDIRTSGVQLVQGNPVCLNGIQVYAEGSCWIGQSGYSFTDEAYPFPLASGDTLFIPTRHPEDLYVQAPSSGVTVYYLYL
jgi:hypothetical protein